MARSGFAIASFGYIIGFVLAAGVVGALASRGGDRSPLPTIGTMLLGNAVDLRRRRALPRCQSLGIDLGDRLGHRHEELPARRRA